MLDGDFSQILPTVKQGSYESKLLRSAYRIHSWNRLQVLRVPRHESGPNQFHGVFLQPSSVKQFTLMTSFLTLFCAGFCPSSVHPFIKAIIIRVVNPVSRRATHFYGVKRTRTISTGVS